MYEISHFSRLHFSQNEISYFHAVVTYKIGDYFIQISFCVPCHISGEGNMKFCTNAENVSCIILVTEISLTCILLCYALLLLIKHAYLTLNFVEHHKNVEKKQIQIV